MAPLVGVLLPGQGEEGQGCQEALRDVGHSAALPDGLALGSVQLMGAVEVQERVAAVGEAVGLAGLEGEDARAKEGKDPLDRD
jgi:hypothetical protein